MGSLSVEQIDSPETRTFLAHNALPVRFTEEDLDQAASGHLVAKVFYLAGQPPTVETLSSTRLDAGADIRAEAQRRGEILAILRLGNRDDLAPGEPAPQKALPANLPTGVVGVITEVQDREFVLISNAEVGGIHAGDIEKLSVRSLFPRLVEAEARHGSVIRAFRHTHLQQGREGLFRSLSSGMGELVRAIERRLPQESVRFGATVTGIGRHADGWSVECGSEKLRARAIGQQASFAPDCSLVFDASAVSERRYSFQDLFRQLPGTSSRAEGETRKRITHGLRARHADVSPDGRQVVFVTNDRSTSTLRIASEASAKNWPRSSPRKSRPESRRKTSCTSAVGSRLSARWRKCPAASRRSSP